MLMMDYLYKMVGPSFGQTRPPSEPEDTEIARYECEVLKREIQDLQLKISEAKKEIAIITEVQDTFDKWTGNVVYPDPGNQGKRVRVTFYSPYTLENNLDEKYSVLFYKRQTELKWYLEEEILPMNIHIANREMPRPNIPVLKEVRQKIYCFSNRRKQFIDARNVINNTSELIYPSIDTLSASMLLWKNDHVITIRLDYDPLEVLPKNIDCEIEGKNFEEKCLIKTKINSIFMNKTLPEALEKFLNRSSRIIIKEGIICE